MPEPNHIGGWYWVKRCGCDSCLYWDAIATRWYSAGRTYTPEEAFKMGWAYLGPCYSPDQVAEMMAAKQKSLRSKIMKEIHAISPNYEFGVHSGGVTKKMILDTLRILLGGTP